MIPSSRSLREGRLADGAGLLDLRASEVFRPDDRLYARSVADDTAPIIAFLGALDALDASDITVTSNLKVILDGEEEAGSPNLVPRFRATGAGSPPTRCSFSTARSTRAAGLRSASGLGGSDPGTRGVRTARSSPQRPLRQLGSESGGSVGAAHRLDEGTRAAGS